LLVLLHEEVDHQPTHGEHPEGQCTEEDQAGQPPEHRGDAAVADRGELADRVEDGSQAEHAGEDDHRDVGEPGRLLGAGDRERGVEQPRVPGGRVLPAVPIAALRLLSVAAGLWRHRPLPVPGRRWLRHRGLAVATGTLRPLWCLRCRRLAIAAGGLSRLREPGLLAVAVRVALRGLVLSHQAAPFVTVSSSTLAVRTDVQAGRTPHPGRCQWSMGTWEPVGWAQQVCWGSAPIRPPPSTSTAGAGHTSPDLDTPTRN